MGQAVAREGVTDRGAHVYRLSREREEFICEIADQQAEDLVAEIAQMETEAQQLAEEIELLTGDADHFEEECSPP